MADWGYVLLNGCRAQSVNTGSVCDAQCRCICTMRLVALYKCHAFGSDASYYMYMHRNCPVQKLSQIKFTRFDDGMHLTRRFS